MRTVIDASIWVSAICFGGTPLDAVDAALESSLLVTCEPIEREVWRVVSRKFPAELDTVRLALGEYLAGALKVSIIGAVRGVCRDPNDDMVLEAALHSNADYILTGDRDLLSLGSFHTARILNARAFLHEVAGQR